MSRSVNKSASMKKHKSHNAILKELKEGNGRFLAGKSLQSSKSSLKKLQDFAKIGQFPKAIVLCCSDSRAPVEMIFDQDLGDLFVIRVAGNVVAPSLVGSVEFAATLFGTRLVLVMGHTQCGAIRATINHIQNTEEISSANIFAIVNRIKPHILPIAKMKKLTMPQKMKRAVEANVRASVDQLSHSSQVIEDLVQKKEMKILGAVLNLSTGQVDFLDM